MIAVVIPTRGFIFTEVLNALDRNLEKYDHEVYRSFTLGIPDSQNELVEQALAENPNYVLFIEEDVVIPDGTIERLLFADADIACLDYGVEGWGCVTKSKDTDEILWCGLGCTLVKKEVFDKLEKPYFRTDMVLRLNDWQWVPANVDKTYGGQDIWFCNKVRDAGFKIKQVPGEAKHIRLARLGTNGLNNGLHLISQKPVIEKHQIL